MRRIKLKNFERHEIVVLCCIYLILILNKILFKDSAVSVFSAFFGITYTILAGKGNPVCYLFGITGSGLYGFLSFHNALWGNLLLYMGYYVPMQILGYFRWQKHLKSDKYEIEKISLTRRELFYTLGLSIIASLLMIYALIHFGDKSPWIDGITSILSIVGMYLTVRRAIEQWCFWMVVNGLSAIMWIKIAFSGEKVYSTVVMWSAYFVLAIYFYLKWEKELKIKSTVD